MTYLLDGLSSVHARLLTRYEKVMGLRRGLGAVFFFTCLIALCHRLMCFQEILVVFLCGLFLSEALYLFENRLNRNVSSSEAAFRIGDCSKMLAALAWL